MAQEPPGSPSHQPAASTRVTLPPPIDGPALAAALWQALTGGPPPSMAPAPEPVSEGVVERRRGPEGGLRERERWSLQRTPGDDILTCTERTWDAAARGASFQVEWTQLSTRVALAGPPELLARLEAALWAVTGLSADEVAVLEVLASSTAFAANVFGQAHHRLGALRYTPGRLASLHVGDDSAALDALDRLERRPGGHAPATLAAALLEGLHGRLELALARVNRGPESPDLALLRADLLSRLARHEEALAAVPPAAPAPFEAARLGLLVALHRRAGRLAEAARSALGLAAAPRDGWTVSSSEAQLVALAFAEDLGDAELAGDARRALGPDLEQALGLVASARRPPSEFLRLVDVPRERLARLR